jgi:arginyl-tRNA synthetase
MTKQEIKKYIADCLEALYSQPIPSFELDYAPSGRGDYAANIGYKLASVLRRSPGDITSEVAGALVMPELERAESAGGYLNITLKDSYWMGHLEQVGPGFGNHKQGSGKKVQVEFISANPTGPTTFGNARGGFIGDTIARVLEHQGHIVTREYYFNDGGTQIQKLVDSVRSAAGLDAPGEVQYSGPYIDDLAQEFGERLSKSTVDESSRLLTAAILERYIRPAVQSMNIEFDVWFNERSLVPDGKLDRVLARLTELGLVYDQDGATWIASSRLGDERDRVFRKSSGDLTYLASDLAYHYDIFTGRGFDWAIKDWGSDHLGQVPSLSLLMKALLPDCRLDFVIHQFVRLMQDGREVKMSKRAGTFVTVEDVIEQVGSDVTRFMFLMRSADSPMDFDLGIAKEQSQKNPYWYVMYSYVRAGSILQQASSKELFPTKVPTEPSELERALAVAMARLPELLETIAVDYGVHALAFYGMELARAFHEYYESDRILSLDKERACAKLSVIAAYRRHMEQYFGLTGITPLSEMKHGNAE